MHRTGNLIRSFLIGLTCLTALSSLSASPASASPATVLLSNVLQVVSNTYSAYTLQSFSAPRESLSAMTMTGPSSSTAGASLTLTGTLALTTGPGIANAPVTVTRSTSGGSPVTLPPVTTNGSGDFTITDVPPVPGTYTYTASYADNASTAGSQATVTVVVSANAATLTLTGPSRVLPGKAFSITGSLALSAGSPPAGTAITVARTNPNGSITPIPQIKTGANGSFTIPDRLPSLGGYTYAASAAATAATTAATGTLKLTVAMATPTLTLSTGAPTALYDSTIHVTAHLGSTDTNRTVSVYYQLVGTGTKRLLKTAKVSSSGNLVLSYPGVTRNVIFTVTFSGDAQYFARSVSVRLGSAVRVAMATSGWYTTTKDNGGTYRVFHSTALLNVAVSVTPNKRGEEIELVGQQWYNNTWNDVTADVFHCTLGSSSTVAKPLNLTQAAGAYYRLRAVFVPGIKDVTNVSYYSGWFYFTVVK